MKRWHVVPLVILLLIGASYSGLRQLARIEGLQLFGEMVSHGPRTRPAVALTFDDGPSLPHTTEVLSILAAHDVTATFYLMGASIDRHKAAAQAIADAGHEIGNHSYTHQRMIFRTPWFVARELRQTDAAIRSLGYQGPIHFRAPYGNKLFVLPWHLMREGRLSVMWSLEGDSDLALQSDPEALAHQVVTRAEAGDIILLHVMYSSRSGSRAALPAIIEGLRARGFDLVTVSAMLGDTTPK